MKLAIFLIMPLILGALTLSMAQTRPTMNLSTLAKQFADTNKGELRKATEEDLEALKKLKLPDSLVAFYREHSPNGTIYGFVNLLPISEMVKESLEDAGPGRDVFPRGFVHFATMDGDAFCFDVSAGKEPRIVLFGHEEPLDFLTRKELLRDKGKVVALNLSDFFEKCLNETLDRDPKY